MDPQLRGVRRGFPGPLLLCHQPCPNCSACQRCLLDTSVLRSGRQGGFGSDQGVHVLLQVLDTKFCTLDDFKVTAALNLVVRVAAYA